MFHRMKQGNGLIAAITLAFVLMGSVPLGAQGIKNRELLGIRVGGMIASGALHDAFGNGSVLELHFIRGITPWLGVDVALSSHSFGASKDHEKDIEFLERNGIQFLDPNGEVDLYSWSVTVGMIALRSLRGRITPTLEGGPGLYSVNTTLPQGLFEPQKTDNRLGLYGGVGLLIRLTKAISLNVNGKYHHVFVGSNGEDTIHFYTGDESARFYDISVGVSIYTG